MLAASQSKALFPAHAGVILDLQGCKKILVPVPRTRGGDPYSIAIPRRMPRCSPHTRG